MSILNSKINLKSGICECYKYYIILHTLVIQLNLIKTIKKNKNQFSIVLI